MEKRFASVAVVVCSLFLVVVASLGAFAEGFSASSVPAYLGLVAAGFVAFVAGSSKWLFDRQ